MVDFVNMTDGGKPATNKRNDSILGHYANCELYENKIYHDYRYITNNYLLSI